jgi:cytidine deaminase
MPQLRPVRRPTLGSTETFPEFSARTRLGFDPREHPADAMAFLLEASLFAYEQGDHYDDFRTSAVGLVIAKGGIARVISGANHKPYPGSAVRVCAESAMLRGATKKGDIFAPVLYLRSPDELKPIVGCADDDGYVPKTLHPCGQCRPNLLKFFGPNLTIALFKGLERKPTEILRLADVCTFYDGRTGPLHTDPSTLRLINAI